MYPWWKCAVWLLLFTHTLFHRHQFFSLCSVEVGLFLNTSYVFCCRTWMTLSDSTRWFGAKWTFTRWTFHHCNWSISWCTLMSTCFIPTWSCVSFQLLCFSSEFHYLLLMHIHMWWVSLSLTHAYSYVVSFIISWLMHIRVQWDVLSNTCTWQVAVSLRISVSLK